MWYSSSSPWCRTRQRTHIESPLFFVFFATLLAVVRAAAAGGCVAPCEQTRRLGPEFSKNNIQLWWLFLCETLSVTLRPTESQMQKVMECWVPFSGLCPIHTAVMCMIPRNGGSCLRRPYEGPFKRSFWLRP